MKKKTIYFVLASLAGLLLALPVVILGAGKPISFTMDDVSSGVSSDGKGAYVSGQLRVGATISSVGDFTGSFYTGCTRSLKINYNSPFDPTDAPFSGIHVVNAAAIGGSGDVITVRDIMSIAVGTTALRKGFILVQDPYVDSSTGAQQVVTQKWNNLNTPPSLLFSVTRTAKNQWVVESQNYPSGDQTSLKFFHDPGAGLAWVFLSGADYHIPIRMTINQP
jgi:hypothetical protein